MTKRQELEVLADAIAKLGPDSYLGPWLASVSDEVERDIRSDIFPTFSLKETRHECAKIREEAKRVLDAAHLSAKDIVAAREKTARLNAQDAKQRFNAAVDRAVSELNGSKLY